MNEACPICQRNKKQCKKYGHLPPKEAETTPWDRLCVDLIGPYKIQCKGKPTLTSNCVMMIDPATGWFEVHEEASQQSDTVANVIEQ